MTVTATLNEAQAFPVSFDWSAAGAAIAESQSGSVSWEAGETGSKTFEVTVTKPEGELWRYGGRAFVISATNVKGALVNDNKNAWNQTVIVKANDGAISNTYTWMAGETYAGSTFTKYTANDRFGDATECYKRSINCEGDAIKVTTNYKINRTSGYHWVTFEVRTSNENYVADTFTGGVRYPMSNATGSFTDSGTKGIAPGTNYLYFACAYGSMTINSVTTEYRTPQTTTTIQSITVPEGTYYSGQVVPVTITLSQYAALNADNTLTINNVECPLLDTPGTESNKFTFGYTVKDADTGTINVTALNGTVYNAGTKQMTIDGSFPAKNSFGTDDGVTLVSDVKRASLDFANAKYGISDDDAGEQVVTVLIPFKSNLESGGVEWVGNDKYLFSTTGIDMSLPDYGDVTIKDCLKSAYFSYDNGNTRYPVYVVRQDGVTYSDGKKVNDAPVALMTRFTPDMNATPYLRQDTLNLFMEMTDMVTDNTKYIDKWENIQTDTKGYAYFDGTGKSEAPVQIGRAYSYYVKGGVMFDPAEYISRGEADLASRTENGWLNYDDGNHVLLWDAEHPENQYDVEIIANNAFYDSVLKGFRAEDTADLTLRYQCSNRKNFTFTDPKYFTWTSSNPDVATITPDEKDKTKVHISITGNPGAVEFTLTAKNGSESKQFNLPSVKLTVLEGKTPFLNISKYSQLRQALTYTDIDIAFSSNVTVRNAQAGQDTTTFTAKLYKAKAVEGQTDTYEKDGEPIWTSDFNSTVEEMLTHITVPGDELTQVGAYALEITTKYAGGVIDGQNTPAQDDLSATAYIVAKQAPAVVKLNKLDSYYVTADSIPEIGYTVTPESDTTQVEYTIQKSGEKVGERKPVSGGKIPFTAGTPTSLKESYVITVYARNNEGEDWSVDSMRLSVYNPDILNQIVADVTAGQIGGTTGGSGEEVGGQTISMDNHGKLENYGISGGKYQLTYDDFTALRTDMSLQKIVSMNYGDVVYGMLSDEMQWESSNRDLVSVNYKQGGIYSDLNNYSYVTYSPTTDFLLVGKDDTGEEKVTITATHANTGAESSFDVTTKTLKDQLYVFQFYPPVKTDVIYTNGKGEKRTLQSNDKGELAVYEPDGIDGSVMTMSKDKDGKTYVGTLFQSDLETGERDVASLQLYPCNNLRLRVISDATLTFLNPDGSKYSGEVTIRAGVYKNGTYCPDAKIRLTNDGAEQDGRKDIKATVKDGKLELHLDPTQFKIDTTNDDEFGGAQPGDNITYVVEYRFAKDYQTGYVMLNASTNLEGASSPADSLVHLRKATGSVNAPQITHQEIQQYYDGEATSYTRNIIDFTDNIGISTRFYKTDLITDVALSGETVTADENGYATYSSKFVPHFAICTMSNKELTGQLDNDKTKADQIINLSDMEDSTLFVFPFSSTPISHSIYTMTDENMSQDGITDEGDNPNATIPVKAVFKRNNRIIKSETLPFGISNLSHQRDLTAEDGGAAEVGKEIDAEVKNTLDIGSIFSQIDVSDMLRKGFVFLGKIQTEEGGEYMPHMMILPTEDPSKFRIVVFVGYNKREDDDDDEPAVSLNYDPNEIADDVDSFKKTLEEMNKDKKKDKKKTTKKKKKKDKDKEDDDDDKPYEINFYGTVVLEATNVPGEKWGIDFCGGNVGTNFELKYEWSQNFVCGPVPFFVSFEAKLNADLEVAFANKKEARAMLIDAALGVSIEAFAGLGFDLSLVAFKLGIFGEVSAKDNFLYLTKSNQTGNKLSIAGAVGIRAEVKLLFISYKKTLCNVPFSIVDKTWGKYDQIKETWEEDGYADLVGLTARGKPYNMHLMSNGIAMVSVDNGNEVENRDYLRAAPKRMQFMSASPAPNDGMTELYSNAYPYSNPVLTDDGNILLYLSDNNNSDAPESVVCYAIQNGDSYTDMGRVDNSENNILADTDAVISGTGNQAFAAWVKQMDSPEKEMHDEVTYDDLGMMLNATEIYASVYNGSEWTVQRLTENTDADMSPTIASSGNRAVVAWRSLSATEMPEEGAEQDITAMFNSENSIRYRIYDGENWKEAQIAYNGTAGTINAIDSAMLSDGTSLLVYTVRTGEDVTSTETFYTVIDPNGDVLTTGRLTNDDYTDANAQVTTVGNQFVVGWYSEHSAGEEKTSDEVTVSHDIGLARINANGSVDANFPESIGGTSASSITSDFHFSAPVNNDDLSRLSIVWSQAKDSSAEEDTGKYQLNAIRFYETDGIIGVTEQTTIAETAKNYKIDHFDTYTDENDEIKAVLVGSDYSAIDGMEVFDTIDLSDLPVQAVNDAGEAVDHVAILEQEPVVSMKLAKGAFSKTEIEVSADTDLYSLMPGLELPVQFTVKNTGTDTVNNVNVQIGTQSKTFTGLHLLPSQSAVLTTDYLVPETVSDVNYTLTADSTGTATGTLVLNRPDVGIGSMKVTRESDKTRDIQVILGNASDIPLVGSGKTVKLAFYKDSNHQQQIGEVITIAPSAYQDIDDDIYVYNQTLNVEDFIGNALEVPEEGIRIYAQTWVDDTEELYLDNNYSTVTFKGLLSKYQSQIIMDSALINNENNGYTVVANISNNSLQNAEIGTVVADILDRRNKVLTSVEISNGELTLNGEQTQSFSVPVPEFSGEPVQVSLRTTEKSVFLDAQTNGGTIEAPTLSLTTDNKPAVLPEATRNGYTFDGWFTEPTGGEQITEDTVLTGGSTIYAHFTYIKKDQNFKIAMNDYDYDGTAPTPTINGTPYGKVTIEYFNADTEELLAEAPSKTGHYLVKVYADGNFYYNDALRTAEYWITQKNMYHVAVKNGTINGETSGEFVPNTIIAVKADEPEAGYKFGYWKKNGNTISYNPTYTFFAPTENVELEAVYVEDTDDIERYGNAVIETVSPDKENKKIQFVSLLNVPEGCKILKAGIVATSDEEKSANLTDENADFVRYGENLTVRNYKYTWTKTNVNETWYVKGYLVYEDANGEAKTVYSDLAKATLDSYETIKEEKILGTAVMESVTPDAEEKKIQFVAMLNVPADCTINKAGIVATSDAAKAENLTAENADYVRTGTTTKHGYRYTWTKTNVNETWYVRPYLVYTDASGKEFTVYGELTSAGLNDNSDTTQSNILSQRLLLAAKIGAGIKLS